MWHTHCYDFFDDSFYYNLTCVTAINTERKSHDLEWMPMAETRAWDIDRVSLSMMAKPDALGTVHAAAAESKQLSDPLMGRDPPVEKHQSRRKNGGKQHVGVPRGVFAGASREVGRGCCPRVRLHLPGGNVSDWSWKQEIWANTREDFLVRDPSSKVFVSLQKKRRRLSLNWQRGLFYLSLVWKKQLVWCSWKVHVGRFHTDPTPVIDGRRNDRRICRPSRRSCCCAL